MTEPVAYMWKTAGGNVLGFQEYKENTPYPGGYVTPLYTSEQLHPRVKMTQAEFDEWFDLYYKNSFLTPLNFLKLISNIENGYPLIYNIYLKGREKQLDLLELWLWFKQERPEETIEIVPDMKWFVRSKEKYHPDMDQGISESGYLYLTQGDIYSIEYYETTTFKDEAQQFDTKEEAEKWTNPLTNAVQLPVEGE